MTVTNAELAQIVARASSLYERLEKEAIAPDKAKINEQLVRSRLTQWCQLIARGNWDKFQTRLAWDNLELNQIAIALGSLPIIDSQTLPNWAHTLNSLIEIIQKKSSFVNLQISFKEVLSPAVEVSRYKLLNRLKSPSLSPDFLPLEVLSESAYQTLETSLAKKILDLCGKTLEFEFSRFRPFGESLFNLLETQASEDNQIQAEYKAFIDNLLQDGGLAFFKKYPVLARLIATTIDFWVEATAEFLEHLKADLPEINQIYENQLFAAKVIEIQTNLSDLHNQNRSVIAIAFNSGLKLVYKPKNLGIEAAFTEFLEWCNNQRDLPLPFKVLKVCDRETYGWVEYVEHLPCEDETAAQRFYQRSGMLLCLLHVLRVVDCHRENLIASGEHFVLIDMETLLHHEAKPMADLADDTAEMEAIEDFWDSVLRTGLLPRWDFSKNEQFAYDISALGSIDPDLALKLYLGEATAIEKIPPNLPFLNGRALSPNDYLDEIVTGFEQMYRFLMKNREFLLLENSPLAKLRSQRVRFIFRPTKVYAIVLKKSFFPELLRDGCDRSIALDFLSRAFLTVQKKPHAWPILQAELKAMEQLDIPYFGAFPDSDALTVGLEKPLEGYFEAPSYQQFQIKMQEFNEADLNRQIEIIKGSFYARLGRNITKILEAQNNLKNNDILSINPLNREQLLQEATRIALEIQERSLQGTDGSIKWIGFGYIANAERFQLMPLSDSLYAGNSGIALFFAALDYVKGTEEFRELALGAVRSLRQDLRSADPYIAQLLIRQGIGGATGLGSLIYSIVKISQFLKDDELLEEAKLLANLITPEAIASDTMLDVTSGAAGAILGLLALCDRTKDPEILEKAVTCGEHLRSHLVSINGAPRAWKILGKKQHTGFSHGAAGIAYALLRLYAVTQNSAYLEAAKEGIAYENSIFSAAAGNWPDLRQSQPNGEPGFMVSWCHGAPGIGLARLGGLSILESDEIRRDIEVSLQTTQNYPVDDVDCVCCGNFGRIETLLVGSQKLSRPQLQEIAAKKAAWEVANAKKMGGYLFPNLPHSAFSPSFFQGTAGIGYELLRLAYPELLPSVLLWE